MDSTKELYFIPILMHAFDAPDIRSSLREAFQEIEQLGPLPEYADGYSQFKALISACFQSIPPETKDDALTNILYALATNTFEGHDAVKSLLVDKIHNNPDLKLRYDRICHDISISEEQLPITFELERDKELVQSVVFSHDLVEQRISGILPGRYRLSLANGRLLWEGTLTSRDVIWEEAFPGKNYRMAADTGDIEPITTFAQELLDGEICITLHPGLESGILTITIKQASI
ncbi:hypothetical protein JW979_09485 [bacterium]|nr:hypothetical protein [candidate division CSSED10-310 bacterium]